MKITIELNANITNNTDLRKFFFICAYLCYLCHLRSAETFIRWCLYAPGWIASVGQESAQVPQSVHISGSIV